MKFKHILTLSIAVIAPITTFAIADLITPKPASAQFGITTVTIDSFKLNRAKNFARQAAEDANGGLSKYRAESSMHGPAFESPYKVNDNGTVTFSFMGSAPETPENMIYESVVTVTLEDYEVNVEYNGEVRENSQSPE